MTGGTTADRGTFPDVLPVEALVAPVASRRTGILSLRRGRLRHDVCYIDGRPTQVDSNAPSESLPMLLVAQGTLDEDAARQLLRDIKGTGVDAGQAMVNGGMLPPEKLEEMGRWRAAILLIKTAAWTEGRYAFRSMSGPRLPGPVLRLRLGRILLKALDRLDLARTLGDRLSPQMGTVLVPAEEPPWPLRELTRDRDAEELLGSLDGKLTLQQALAGSHLSVDDAVKLLWLATAAGCLVEATPAWPDADAIDDDALDLLLSDELPLEELDPAGEPPPAAPPAEERAHAPPDAETAAPPPDEDAPPDAARVADDAERTGDDQPPPPTDGAARLAELGKALFGDRFDAAQVKPTSSSTFRRASRGHADSVTTGEFTTGPEGTSSGGFAASTSGSFAASTSGSFAAAASGSFAAAASPAAGDGAAASDASAPPAATTSDSVPAVAQGLDADQRALLAEIEAALQRAPRQNHFELMGLTHEASESQIRTAYFDLARRFHPDKFTEQPAILQERAQQLFELIGAAHQVLSSATRRQAYIDREILGKMSEEDEAMEKVRQIMEAEKSFKMGMRLMHAGQLADAREHFRRAHEGYPDDVEYRCYYGFMTFKMLQRSDPVEAEAGERLVQGVLDENKDHPVAMHLLGKIAMLRNQNRKALDLLRRSLQARPDNEDARRDYKRVQTAVVTGQSVGRPDKDRSSSGLAGLFSRFKK